ncbi:MAG: hypothetical protein JF888_09895 [Candidatus Dormibacteraeota bacterium]|uniref:Uncharacterized protein n=2 Tax=Candidatus Dormibacteraceae TaxID=3126998 RepID=A0A934K3X8_9BACT|nr:hypothetical protein [Candidatus Dormibacteraeota bacterium]MBJ7603483.1 hypothetical protein [Candidatus Dormibacteraeota bacterium]
MEPAYREALERQVRQGVARKNLTTFLIEVQPRHGSWIISVPEIPGLQCRAEKRQDIQPTARAAIAAALRVPQHFFELHIRLWD